MKKTTVLVTGCSLTEGWMCCRAHQGNPALWICIAMLWFMAGCTEEIVMLPPVTENSLVDPSIQPKVLFTYPANATEGPFNVYSPVWTNSSYPHFILQFNKLILSSSIASTSVYCTGFDHPTIVEVIAPGGSSSTLALNVQAFNIVDVSSSRKTYYRVGTTYTVTVDSTIHDINGNRIERPYSFSFQPEPYFRLLDHFLLRAQSLPQGDSVDALVQPWLKFNGPVEPRMFGSIQLTPAPNGKWTYQTADSLTIQFVPDSGLRMSTSYSITVPQEMEDVAGNQLRQAVALRFHTFPFAVTAYSYLVRDTLQYLGIPFSFSATGLMDTVTFRSAFTISPPVDGILSMSPTYCTFTPVDNFAPATHYTIGISSRLRSLYGDSLSAPVAINFSTPPFHVLYTLPVDGSRNSSPGSPIRVECNGRIDTTTVHSAFIIVPSMSGRFEFYGNVFYFIPTSSVSANTTFHVEISTALHARGGYPIAAPYSFSFTTGVN